MEKRDSALPGILVSEHRCSQERLSRKYHWSYLDIEIRCCVPPTLIVIPFIVPYWFDHCIGLVHCQFSKHDLEMLETNRQIITIIFHCSILSHVRWSTKSEATLHPRPSGWEPSYGPWLHLCAWWPGDQPPAWVNWLSVNRADTPAPGHARDTLGGHASILTSGWVMRLCHPRWDGLWI